MCSLGSEDFPNAVVCSSPCLAGAHLKYFSLSLQTPISLREEHQHIVCHSTFTLITSLQPNTAAVLHASMPSVHVIVLPCQSLH